LRCILLLASQIGLLCIANCECDTSYFHPWMWGCDDSFRPKKYRRRPFGCSERKETKRRAFQMSRKTKYECGLSTKWISLKWTLHEILRHWMRELGYEDEITTARLWTVIKKIKIKTYCKNKNNALNEIWHNYSVPSIRLLKYNLYWLLQATSSWCW